MQDTKKSNVKQIVLGVIAFILFVVAYVGVLGLYRSEKTISMTQFAAEQGADPNHVEIGAKLMSVDPVKGDLVVRLQFFHNGDLLSQDGVSLAKTLVLNLNSATGKAEHIFKKGEGMNPTEVTVSLFNGFVTDYPLDVNDATLVISLVSPIPADSSAGKDAPPEYESIPVVVNFTGALIGYRIAANESSDKEAGYCEINMIIHRSWMVIAFAALIMSLKWLLAMSALLVMLSVVVRGRKVELGMFSWLAALLFAMPPLRNLMPNVPPIGSLPDFLAFFWAEDIVVISLAMIVFTWLRRSGAK